MKWRWHEFHGTEHYKKYCLGNGLSRRMGATERKGGLAGNPLIEFLNKVHRASDVTQIKCIVEEAYPSWWQAVRS